MITREIFIENPYEHIMMAEPLVIKDGKTKRRERREKQRKK